MRALFVFIAAANIIAAWIPTSTNSMDLISTSCMCMACLAAYWAGAKK